MKTLKLTSVLSLCLLLVLGIYDCCAQQMLLEDTIITSKDILCDCPEPTKSQYLFVCMSGYEGETGDEGSTFGFKFQEHLWKMSCADPLKDSNEIAYGKIRCMWNKYREHFLCVGYTGVMSDGNNITKFSIETGFPTFVIQAVKRYNLDLNFKDPTDGKTIMDFLKDEMIRYEAMTGDYSYKIKEYQRLYTLLKTYGVKHANEL